MTATKVNKIKWEKLGLKLFSIKGVEGINVEQMATKLDCKKSSFYWHFKSNEKFLDVVIQYLGYSKKDADLNAEILINFYVGWVELTNCKTTIDHEDIDHAVDLIKAFVKF